MASIPGILLEFFIRRLSIFNRARIDPSLVRAEKEKSFWAMRAHPKVKSIPASAGGVPSEWLVPEDAPDDRALLYIHGGGWFMGSYATHRGLVSKLAYRSGIRALSINYRLAPEHPFPAGLEDCLTAFEWLTLQGIPANKIIVAGDSAGGNLTLALLIARREAGKPLPAGAVAISPATDLADIADSHKTRLQIDPYFSQMGTNTIISDYITNHDPYHPMISPLYADLRGLPPLLIHVGDHEMLLDDAVLFGEKAVAARVDAQTVVWPGMFHVFQVFDPYLPEARRANAQIVEFIQSRLG